MRSRKFLMITICFAATWVLITYIFILKGNHPPNLELQKKLIKLETGVKEYVEEENNSFQVFLNKLKEKIEEKSARSIDNTIQVNNENEMEENKTSIIENISIAQQISQAENVESTTFKNIVELAEIVETHLPNGEPIIPVLVLACNRVSVSQCLDNLIQYRPSAKQFPIIVSQDCGDPPTKEVILSYKDQVNLIEQPDQSDIYVPPREKKFKGYYKISRHYGWALNTTFGKGFDYVIIVEDDLNVAPDFFEYFLGTYNLLKKDPSLWCVSAWNDNGKLGNIDSSAAELLYRTDFFPGLGWMLTKELWRELSVKWPKSFWDDWIRHPEQRKDRVCIRPEISRTRTFGKVGVSNGLFFDKYLKYIKLSDEYVHFTKMNLSYLLKDIYDDKYIKMVYNTPIVTYGELRNGLVTVTGPVRIQYNTKDQYKRTAKFLGLMDDFKSGVPRTAYHGIISLFYNERRVFLAPGANWKKYDLSWS
ncbi:alpha-1,3-mannosyl-glycoprotein 2-beta-N-acetylglucosaminyltransferase [Condylostylus longicornis]|uniref:alpha-1,3-mannosyl-glycoprotein 2-beta-N-acetylglucosaminyltransferase n=1 Tax=Condylostylus longicornis TaxID=2530218 RepID=UPI00244DC24F|nr:alpha-1,3-mannosyl-glycoprotein 2-beta-N-acetylglucosaminyltransferase [Condylostylus longicornis]